MLVKVSTYFSKVISQCTATAKYAKSCYFTCSELNFIAGKRVQYYPNGKKWHEVTYKHGRRTGQETLWREDGTIEWQWNRDLKTNKGVWTQFWDNGQKRVESTWSLRPVPRDLPDFPLNGCVAEGVSKHWDRNGKLVATYMFHNGVEVGSTAEESSGIQNEGK